MQESTGFIVSELVFGHTIRLTLTLQHDQVAQPEPPRNLTDYVSGFWHRLYVVRERERAKKVWPPHR